MSIRSFKDYYLNQARAFDKCTEIKTNKSVKYRSKHNRAECAAEIIVRGKNMHTAEITHSRSAALSIFMKSCLARSKISGSSLGVICRGAG